LKGDVEEPSDFHGVAYTKFDSGGVWKAKLAGELQYAKVPFDIARLPTA
jgi:predicted nucleotide-binding protein